MVFNQKNIHALKLTLADLDIQADTAPKLIESKKVPIKIRRIFIFNSMRKKYFYEYPGWVVKKTVK